VTEHGKAPAFNTQGELSVRCPLLPEGEHLPWVREPGNFHVRVVRRDGRDRSGGSV